VDIIKYTQAGIALAMVMGLATTYCVQAAPIFTENFDGYSGNQNATQVNTGLKVAFGGNVTGWSKSGTSTMHAVDLSGSGNWAIMFYQDNVITLTTGIAANDSGATYKVDFDYGTATYNENTQATAAGDGLLVEILRADNSVLASNTYTNVAWANPANVNLSAGLHGTIQYVGDGSGVVRLRIGPTQPLNSGRFEGEIDNLSVSLLPTLIVTLTAPTAGQQFPLGSSVTATATVANGSSPYTVNFYTNYNSGAYGLAGTTNASPYTINLVPLAAGTYGIYATVTDNVSSNATSATNTFTVFMPFDRTAWGCSMPITFTNDARLNTLTNFPVLVVLDTNKVNYSQFQANAQDLRFADMNGGIELAYQVESWNTTSNSYVWVKIPTLTAGRTITAYWGNSGASMPSYRTNGLAWDSTFAGVWHLGEAGNTTAGGYRDSTINANNGTGVGMSAGTEVASMISTGQNLNGTSQEIQAADSTSLRPGTAVSMSVWIKATALAASYTHLLHKRGTTASTYGLWTDSSKKLYFETAGGALTGTTVLTAGQWYHVAATYDGSNMRVYLNGVQDGSVARTGAIDNGATTQLLRIGHGPFNDWFNGIMDEPRVSNVGRSANWIWAEYANVAQQSTFVTFGDVQPCGTLISFF
jgi:hypothetical protein